MEEIDVVEGFSSVIKRINAVCLKNGLKNKPRVVAVSKTKPKELIINVYNQGQRQFGENYIQELVEKSNDPEILEKCKEIKWHFIGHLQKNKINKIITVPGLDVLETLDSEKLAVALNAALEKSGKEQPLKVMVQVNTSGEEEKNGCEPNSCWELVDFVLKNCPHLKFVGLMTIGQYGYDTSLGPNPDFLRLIKCRDGVCEKLNLQKNDVELSMGMSDDFEQAIELGSTNVRVGTVIFGARAKKTKESGDITEGMANVTVN
ncbi:pyridoxal phosphate homeostasis protein isoform X1 [Halyomorpha halys]|uniref:pyridoxal phosphate homeostasis protein isoform X1 n=1 Tax=Halyomorpha halys TaxID=286706 RepID=UPI0006D4FB78|nr:pyridoxal phosphate homeostasis protein isoform X2 [Halyomorpha halys]XP_014291020.1 pyridoxal phosphate homeostasis protein isoform X2 [Halyomorpha halys]